MNFEFNADCEYVVIGDPVEHSVSPPMQNAAFEKAGLGSPYGKVRVPKEEMAAFTAFASRHLKGFNITVPNKQAVIPFLDAITPEAAAAQSVNTVKLVNGKLHGDSTDGYGLQTALEEAFGVKVEGNVFTFIGCGGAVQAVAYHFAARKAAELRFINRTLSKAKEFCDGLKAAYPDVKTACSALDDRAGISGLLSGSAVLIQGSSVGLNADDPSPVPVELLPDGICCYDTIYKRTAFLLGAQKKGLKTADGRTMLLHQGARSFEIWTGIAPDVDAMRVALNAELDARMK